MLEGICNSLFDKCQHIAQVRRYIRLTKFSSVNVSFIHKKGALDAPLNSV